MLAAAAAPRRRWPLGGGGTSAAAIPGISSETTSRVRAGRAGTKNLSNFIFGPEPDRRIRRFKLHTVHRVSTNRLSNAPQSGDPATALGLKNKKMQFKKPPRKHQQSIQNQSKTDQKSIKNRPKSRSGGILEASWRHLGASWGVLEAFWGVLGGLEPS